MEITLSFLLTVVFFLAIGIKTYTSGKLSAFLVHVYSIAAIVLAITMIWSDLNVRIS